MAAGPGIRLNHQYTVCRSPLRKNADYTRGRKNDGGHELAHVRRLDGFAHGFPILRAMRVRRPPSETPHAWVFLLLTDSVKPMARRGVVRKRAHTSTANITKVHGAGDRIVASIISLEGLRRSRMNGCSNIRKKTYTTTIAIAIRSRTQEMTVKSEPFGNPISLETSGWIK